METTKEQKTIAQNSTDLTADQRTYLEWLCLPVPLRTPKTKTEYSEQTTVPRRTLYYWENNPLFNQERLNHIKQNQKNYTAQILETLRDKAISGDIQAIRTWLEWVEGTENTLNIKHTGNVDSHIVFQFEVMSDTEFAEKAAARTTKSDEGSKQL